MKPQLVIISTTGMQYVLHRGLLAAFFIPVPFFHIFTVAMANASHLFSYLTSPREVFSLFVSSRLEVEDSRLLTVLFKA